MQKLSQKFTFDKWDDCMKANPNLLADNPQYADLFDIAKANVYPRSSTYKNFGIILANSVGQIDNSYSGENDCWKFPAIAMRDTIIHKNDRICQFEIQKIQPEIEFVEVDHLDDESRGGIGSTGTN